MDERQIDVDGQRIAFAQSEGGGRAVIFVHGNSSSARTWQPVMTGEFGQRFRCLAFDLPGHGSSAPAGDAEDYSLPGYAQVLAGFAAATGAADAVIVGWSLGGHIALEAAPAMPEAAGYVVFGTRQLTIPTLWRGAVQLIPGAGHAPHQEEPAAFTALLDQFIADLP